MEEVGRPTLSTAARMSGRRTAASSSAKRGNRRGSSAITQAQARWNTCTGGAQPG